MERNNPVSRTAYYCCGVRMLDAETKHPVVNDRYAVRFMNEEGLKTFSAFKHFKAPNASNIARHRIVDDILRDFIRTHDDPTIIIIGAGFDSRAYRLTGGNWIELDEPHLIEYKNEKLPIAVCKNSLTRIPIHFADESIDDKLKHYASRKSVIVVIEGVLMYLTEATVRSLLGTLVNIFPTHEVACDLMTKQFFEKYSYKIHEKLNNLGATFSFIIDDPQSVFLDRGYQLISKTSTVMRAVELKILNIPTFILRWFMKPLIAGYAIYHFKKV